MANVKKPFMRSYSLGSVFKRKRGTPYHLCEEDALLDTGAIDSPTLGDGNGRPMTSPTHAHRQLSVSHDLDEQEDREETDSVWRKEGSRSPSAIAPGSTQLVDCFYLGACDMTGRTIRGRGCIDDPAGRIWEHTQEKRRKNSLPSSFRVQGSTGNTFSPKYVRLAAGKDDLQIFDDIANELIEDFSYRRISFVGTHPKYNRLFAFIAEGKGSHTPYLHAFKCEDKSSASDTATALSTVFEKKIAELLAESDRLQGEPKPQTIRVDVHATLT